MNSATVQVSSTVNVLCSIGKVESYALLLHLNMSKSEPD